MSAGAARHVVAPAGDDRAGDGSPDRPWATLSQAAKKAVSGDTIRLTAGEFQDKIMVMPAPGVSIEGAGIDKTVIRSGVKDTACLNLRSLAAPDGSVVDGKQSIHDLTIDGGKTTRHAVEVNKRHNVEVFNLKAINCTQMTIFAIGGLNAADDKRGGGIVEGVVKPADTSQWMRGFKVHDCIIEGEMPVGVVAAGQGEPGAQKGEMGAGGAFLEGDEIARIGHLGGATGAGGNAFFCRAAGSGWVLYHQVKLMSHVGAEAQVVMAAGKA